MAEASGFASTAPSPRRAIQQVIRSDRQIDCRIEIDSYCRQMIGWSSVSAALKTNLFGATTAIP
jgi:hypothetical protein